MTFTERLKRSLKPQVRITFYLDFDSLTNEERDKLREIIRGTGADFRFDKQYSLGEKRLSISLPFITKQQFDILKGGFN